MHLRCSNFAWSLFELRHTCTGRARHARLPLARLSHGVLNRFRRGGDRRFGWSETFFDDTFVRHEKQSEIPFELVGQQASAARLRLEPLEERMCLFTIDVNLLENGKGDALIGVIIAQRLACKRLLIEIVRGKANHNKAVPAVLLIHLFEFGQILFGQASPRRKIGNQHHVMFELGQRGLASINALQFKRIDR